MSTQHVFDFLSARDKRRPSGIVVLFGDEPFLKRLALAELRKLVVGDDADVPVSTCSSRLDGAVRHHAAQ